MPRHLSELEIAAYRRDGAVFPVSILSGTEARAHRDRLEAAEAERGSLHYMVKPYLVFSSAREIALHPKLLDAVEDMTSIFEDIKKRNEDGETPGTNI